MDLDIFGMRQVLHGLAANQAPTLHRLPGVCFPFVQRLDVDSSLGWSALGLGPVLNWISEDDRLDRQKSREEKAKGFPKGRQPSAFTKIRVALRL